jgi:hypothetical protein
MTNDELATPGTGYREALLASLATRISEGEERAP